MRACGVGVDILDLERARRFVAAHRRRGLRRFLLPSEFNLWKRSRNPVLAFALIFCAKEAASKAAGVALRSPGDFKNWRVGLHRGSFTVIFSSPEGCRQSPRFALGSFIQKNHAGVLCVAYHPGKRDFLVK